MTIDVIGKLTNSQKGPWRSDYIEGIKQWFNIKTFMGLK